MKNVNVNKLGRHLLTCLEKYFQILRYIIYSLIASRFLGPIDKQTELTELFSNYLFWIKNIFE